MKRLTMASVVVLAAVGAILVATPWVASSMLRSALEEHGFRCDAVSLSFAADLSRGDLEPLRCEASEGRLERLIASRGARFTRSGLTLATLDIPELEVVPTMDASPGDAASAGVADVLSGRVPEPLRRTLDAFAQLAGRGSVPAVTVGTLALNHPRGRVLAEEISLRSATPSGIEARVASVQMPGRRRGWVRVDARLARLEGHATPAAASLAGQLVIDVDVGPLEERRSVGFRLRGADLDTDAPTYDAWVEPGEILEGLRALLTRGGALGDRLDALREGRDTRQEVRQERRDTRMDARVDRRRDRRERLQDRRDPAAR